MPDQFLTLAEIDTDGAIQETAARAGVSRATLLKRGALGGGAIIGASALMGALPTIAFGATKNGKAAASDVDILNYALTLEYLEAAFYAQAVGLGKLTGPAAKLAKVVASHEAQHVAFLKTALGTSAVALPKFDFKGTTADQTMFLQTAMALEDTGVSAYAGAAPLITNKKTLSAALSVHSVEARHASWVRDVIGMGGTPSPAPVPFDPAKTKAAVLAIVTGTGFIVA